MTSIEKEALYFFKEYTLLQLKAFRVELHKQYATKAGGATEPYELQVINTAIEFHRIYVHLKLDRKLI